MTDRNLFDARSHLLSREPLRYFWLYRITFLLIAIIYGAVVSQIPFEDFQDFNNYLVYPDTSWIKLLGLLEQGVLTVFSNEPLWLIINASLRNYLETETVVRLIIFGSAFSVCWLMLRYNQKHFFWILVFLLMPMVLKNNLIHIRQGAAIAIFLCGWFSSTRYLRWLFMGLAPFIHSSFFIVLLVYFTAKGLTKLRLGPDLRTLVLLSLSASIVIGLGWVATVLRARQAEEFDFTVSVVSGLNFVFWFTILVITFMEGRRFFREHSFEVGMIILYLVTYWFIEVTARIFESTFLLVLLAGLGLTGWRRFAFLAAISIYGVAGWIVRIKLPLLGFGVI